VYEDDELPESPVPRDFSPLPLDGPFDTAVELMARLIEATLIESIGLPVQADSTNGPVRRQGVSYQHSGFSNEDIVGWRVDVTSWSPKNPSDWITHLDELEGDVPVLLMTGSNWALTVCAGQPDSEVPDLGAALRQLVPEGFVQWSREQNATWFDARFTTTSAIVDELRTSGFEVDVTGPPAELPDYFSDCLVDDTFGVVSLRVPGGPAATVYLLIDDNWAENASNAFSGYLSATLESATVSGDGWVARVVECESDEVVADDFAQGIADALDATFTSSAFVDLPVIDRAFESNLWGPQAAQMRAMISWASGHFFAVPQEEWDDARLLAWERVTAALEAADRFDEGRKAESLMAVISTNDFFTHTGIEALRALAVRDLIDTADYDEFTLPWRSQVGRIHPDDAAVEVRSRREPQGKY